MQNDAGHVNHSCNHVPFVPFMYFRNRFAVDTNTRDNVPLIDDSVDIQDPTFAVSIERKKPPVKSLNNSSGGAVIPSSLHCFSTAAVADVQSRAWLCRCVSAASLIVSSGPQAEGLPVGLLVPGPVAQNVLEGCCC